MPFGTYRTRHAGDWGGADLERELLTPPNAQHTGIGRAARPGWDIKCNYPSEFQPVTPGRYIRTSSGLL